MHLHGVFAGAALMLGAVPGALAATELSRMTEDPEHVRTWNRFADDLYRLHQQRVSGREIRTEESFGGYGGTVGDPEFYREVEYFDRATGRLLSRIQWERQNPDTIHVIEVFVHDSKGRVVRDYLAAYLPEFRNAPIQTLINLHGYDDQLHGFRQFDASGNRIYEQCRGEYLGTSVFISLDEDRLPPYGDDPDLFESGPYLACFEYVPIQAGPYVNPLTDADSGPVGSGGTRTSEHAEAVLSGLNQKIADHPDDGSLYLQRGRTLFDLHEFEAAAADFAAALQRNGQLDEAQFWQGMALGRAGRLDESIRALTEYLERHPGDSRAYTKRGVRHIWNGNLAAAKQDLTRAIELDPGNAEAHDDLGVIYDHGKQFDTALRHFRRTVALDPTYQKGFHNLAMALHLTSQPTPALEAVNRSLRLLPDSRDSLLLKGQILLSLGRKTEAEKLFQQAEFAPEHGDWTERFPVR